MEIVINSYGSTLQKENGLFLISGPEGEQRFPCDVVKTITIGKSARITSDAILLAIQHKVDILFVNDQGKPEGRVWSVQYGSISNIRKAQLNFLYSPAVVDWVKDLIFQKIDSQVALLLALQPGQEELKLYNSFRSAINSMEDYKRKISREAAACLSDIAPALRGWEGAASRKYFSCIALLMPAFYVFDTRDRQPARDPFNALLNYAYGILYGKTEGALIRAGIDPYVGIFHRDDYNRPALVYDFIEYFRAWMDYVVIRLCVSEAIPAEAFERQEENGAVKLAPLAKRILIQSVNDYLGEIISLNQKTMSRLSHLEAAAFRLADLFVKNGTDVTG